jgi:hypothetical protein
MNILQKPSYRIWVNLFFGVHSIIGSEVRTLIIKIIKIPIFGVNIGI